MRVIAGSARGRRLSVPKGLLVRPTSDKVREAIFNILGHDFHYKHVLDLFAGTGAMGIEALSRGAENAVFVDRGDSAVKIIKKNLDICGFAENAMVIKMDAISLLTNKSSVKSLQPRKACFSPFDLIFIDPPYEAGFTDAVMELIDKNEILTPNGVIVAETSKRIVLKPVLSNMGEFDKRQYGDTIVTFYRNKE